MSDSERPSDLSSFANNSESTTYEGPNGQNAGSDPLESTNFGQKSLESGILALFDKQMSISEAKSEEISSLKVSLKELQSEFDKKDETCQQQAMKIRDLVDKNASLEETLHQEKVVNSVQEARIKRMQNEVSTLEHSNADLKEDIQQKDSANKKMILKVQQMKGTIDNCNHQVRQLEIENGELRKTIDNLRATVENKRSEVKSLSLKGEQLKQFKEKFPFQYHHSIAIPKKAVKPSED